MSENSISINLADRDEAVLLFGPRDQFLRMIREALQVRVVARGDTIQIEGPPDRTTEAVRVFEQLRQMLRQHGRLTPENVRTVMAIVHGGPESVAALRAAF